MSSPRSIAPSDRSNVAIEACSLAEEASAPARILPRERQWWRDAVVYQIYVRSFADSNGDGVGDLRGVLSKLDHCAWLGVDTLWLSPIHPSPNEDWGYDVSDYFGVAPELGTLADFDALVAAAGERGIRMILDLVPNHTSDRHPWFLASRAGRSAAERDRYVWADGRAPGEPPNNWVSSFGGPAWTYDPASGQWYLHHFLASQPDLDWWSSKVRRSFEDVMRFWFDRGVAGFRIDVCHMIFKDRELRDNPPATDDDPPFLRMLGQRLVYDSMRPETHALLRSWRAIADSYATPRLLLGETYVFDLDDLASFYGEGDELHLAFNMPFLHSPFEAPALRAVVDATEKRLGADHWPVWTLSNHDLSRFPSRWCDGDERKIRCALVLLFALRGTPVLYYGDEIGMVDTPIPRKELRDPVGKRFWPSGRGRDPARTPMPWTGVPGAGFTSSGTRPWLRIGTTERNVADQREERGSILGFCRALIALRRTTPDLRSGAYAPIAAPPDVWAWRRGERHLAALNLGREAATLEGIRGTIVVGTECSRAGEIIDGRLRVPANEAVIVAFR
jgi:alpha-glucosidase